jgi:hypothetical protein
MIAAILTITGFLPILYTRTSIGRAEYDECAHPEMSLALMRPSLTSTR